MPDKLDSSKGKSSKKTKDLEKQLAALKTLEEKEKAAAFASSPEGIAQKEKREKIDKLKAEIRTTIEENRIIKERILARRQRKEEEAAKEEARRKELESENPESTLPEESEEAEGPGKADEATPPTTEGVEEVPETLKAIDEKRTEIALKILKLGPFSVFKMRRLEKEQKELDEQYRQEERRLQTTKDLKEEIGPFIESSTEAEKEEKLRELHQLRSEKSEALKFFNKKKRDQESRQRLQEEIERLSIAIEILEGEYGIKIGVEPEKKELPKENEKGEGAEKVDEETPPTTEEGSNEEDSSATVSKEWTVSRRSEPEDRNSPLTERGRDRIAMNEESLPLEITEERAYEMYKEILNRKQEELKGLSWWKNLKPSKWKNLGTRKRTGEYINRLLERIHTYEKGQELPETNLTIEEDKNTALSETTETIPSPEETTPKEDNKKEESSGVPLPRIESPTNIKTNFTTYEERNGSVEKIDRLREDYRKNELRRKELLELEKQEDKKKMVEDEKKWWERKGLRTIKKNIQEYRSKKSQIEMENLLLKEDFESTLRKKFPLAYFVAGKISDAVVRSFFTAYTMTPDKKFKTMPYVSFQETQASNRIDSDSLPIDPLENSEFENKAPQKNTDNLIRCNLYGLSIRLLNPLEVVGEDGTYDLEGSDARYKVVNQSGQEIREGLDYESALALYNEETEKYSRAVEQEFNNVNNQ